MSDEDLPAVYDSADPGGSEPAARPSTPAPGTPEHYAQLNRELYANVLDYQDRRRGEEPPARIDEDAPQRDLAADGDERPQIVIDPDVTAVVNAAERALAAMGGIYVRGRKLTRVVRDKGRSDWMRRPDGSPEIAQIRPAALVEQLSRAAVWITVRKGRGGEPTPTRTIPPGWVAAALAEREEWDLPHIEGVAESPVFRADGTILDEPGYDPDTRLLYDPRGEWYPPVPAEPTHADATQALADLLAPFSEFPFIDDSARAATAALILSLVGRAAISGQVPLFSAQAPTPGSGKGLLIAAASLIGTGRLAPMMAQAADDEENRKRLLALAIESPRLIVIDNVEGTFGTPSLAMAMTTGEIRDRKLGATETVAATLRSVWAITGNNVQFKSDFGRRVVPIDLDPQIERPESRRFKRRDLLGWVEEQRPRLVVAALTVLRAFVTAGRPDQGLDPVGSYESWDRLVRRAVYWAGGVDPMGGVARVQAEADDDTDRIRVLLHAWRMSLGGRSVTANEALRWAESSDSDLKDAMAAFCKDGKATARGIGYALRKLQGRIVSGLKIRRDGADRTNNAKWVVDDASRANTDDNATKEP